MAITALSASVSRREYGRREVVDQVLVGATGGAADAGTFTWRLRKVVDWSALPATDPIVWSEAGVPIGTGDSRTAFSFDLGDDYQRTTTGGRLDLVHYTDAQGRRRGSSALGRYYVEVELEPVPSGVSAGTRNGPSSFDVVPLSVQQVREGWLYERGARAILSAVPSRKQATARTLLTETNELMKQAVPDEFIRDALRRAGAWWEAAADCPLRPQRFVASPHLDDTLGIIGRTAGVHTREALPAGFDKVVDNRNLRDAELRRFGYLNVGLAPLLDLERVFSVYLNSITYEYDLTWVVPEGFESGFIHVMPRATSSSPRLTFPVPALDLLTDQHGMTQGDMLPAYWAVVGTWGVQDITGLVDEAIGMRAAAELMLIAAAGRTRAATSESRSTGGSSESYGYGQMPFGELAKWMQEQAERAVSRWRGQVKGVEFSVLG